MDEGAVEEVVHAAPPPRKKTPGRKARGSKRVHQPRSAGKDGGGAAPMSPTKGALVRSPRRFEAAVASRAVRSSPRRSGSFRGRRNSMRDTLASPSLGGFADENMLDCIPANLSAMTKRLGAARRSNRHTVLALVKEFTTNDSPRHRPAAMLDSSFGEYDV